jgi:hypothetical protein
MAKVEKIETLRMVRVAHAAGTIESMSTDGVPSERCHLSIGGKGTELSIPELMDIAEAIGLFVEEAKTKPTNAAYERTNKSNGAQNG